MQNTINNIFVSTLSFELNVARRSVSRFSVSLLLYTRVRFHESKIAASENVKYNYIDENDGRYMIFT